MAELDVAAATEAYLLCQLWAQLDMDHDGDCLDANYTVDDIDPGYRSEVRDEIAGLAQANSRIVGEYLAADDGRSQYSRSELFGHDLYLTREGHGTGFWDRGLGDLGDQLDKMAKDAGSAGMLFDDGSGRLRA